MSLSNNADSVDLCTPLSPKPMHLWDALGVVSAVGDATTLGASGWARPADATALAVECGATGSGGGGGSCGGSGGSDSGGAGGASAVGGGWCSSAGRSSGCSGGSGGWLWVGTAASEWAWTRDDVGGERWVVDVDKNTRVIIGISAWEVDSWRRSRATADDVDLGAGHVELSSQPRASAVESDQFSSEEIVSWWDTAWDGEVDESLVGVELVDSPGVGGDVETIFVDLEPFKASDSAAESVVDLSKVDHDWSLVGGVDGIGKIIWIWAVTAVMPFHGQLGTRWDSDNVGWWWGSHGVDATVADDVVGQDIVDGTVVTANIVSHFVKFIRITTGDSTYDGTRIPLFWP